MIVNIVRIRLLFRDVGILLTQGQQMGNLVELRKEQSRAEQCFEKFSPKLVSPSPISKDSESRNTYLHTSIPLAFQDSSSQPLKIQGNKCEAPEWR